MKNPRKQSLTTDGIGARRVADVGTLVHCLVDQPIADRPPNATKRNNASLDMTPTGVRLRDTT